MKRFKKLRSSLSFNIIGAIVLLMLVFSWVVSIIGYMNFTESFMREYAVSTYHMADTATMLVKGDDIDEYLQSGGRSDGYLRTKGYLESYCERMQVSIVYVIKVDTSDYGRFTSVFNAVGSDTPYSPWEIGYQQATTNEEYAAIYRDIYENGLEYGTVYRTTNLKGAPPHITTLVPVKNTAGEVVSLLCIQRPMEELLNGRRPYLINVAVSTVIMAVFAVVIAALYLRRQFVKPVRKIAAETVRFADENKKSAPLGNVSRIDEISELARSIDKMEDDMVRYIENLTAVTVENERISTELSLATRIQAAMLPNVFPPFPERTEFDLYASMTPAKAVGGDFYDFFLIDDDHLCVTIADVSGKGVPAALFMMASKIVLASNAVMGKSPAAILTDTNAAICANNREQMFVTVWLGILEISTGKLTAANAGHEYPMLKAPDGGFELYKDRHGFVIGGMDGVRYKEYEIQLKPGSKLFVYTDGVAEATDANGELFGTERTLQALNREPDASPRQVLDNVRAGVDAFVKDAEQFDDLTMLCLEYKG